MNMAEEGNLIQQTIQWVWVTICDICLISSIIDKTWQTLHREMFISYLTDSWLQGYCHLINWCISSSCVKINGSTSLRRLWWCLLFEMIEAGKKKNLGWILDIRHYGGTLVYLFGCPDNTFGRIKPINLGVENQRQWYQGDTPLEKRYQIPSTSHNHDYPPVQQPLWG